MAKACLTSCVPEQCSDSSQETALSPPEVLSHLFNYKSSPEETSALLSHDLSTNFHILCATGTE